MSDKERGDAVIGEDSKTDEEFDEDFLKASPRKLTASSVKSEDIGDASDLLEEDEYIVQEDEKVHVNDEEIGQVISGEASESEDETEELAKEATPISTSSGLDVDKDSFTKSDSEPSFTQGLRPESLVDTSPRTESGSSTMRTFVDSVLHQKLFETHQSLNRNLTGSWSRLVRNATSDLQSIHNQFSKTRQLTQETSHLFRNLSNHLFRMEDSVDILATCKLLPNIKL